MKENFSEKIETLRLSVEDTLKKWLPSSQKPGDLFESMRYSTLNGGKRLRAMLCIAACEFVGGTVDQALDSAASIECMHAYSLVHDDLPCMDDDELRRGKPTNHIVYGEALATLAGDALQALSYEVILQSDTYNDQQKVSLLKILNDASGSNGMVLGQALDMEGSEDSGDLASLKNIHRHKTGAMITASLLIGAISGGEDVNSEKYSTLQHFGEKIGLAFQITDDVLDATSNSETLGKTAGKDSEQNKTTYVSLLGLEKSLDEAKILLSESVSLLQKYSEKSLFLEHLSKKIVNRIS